MRVKLSKVTKNTILSTLTNYLSTLSEDDEIEIEFSNVDNGSEDKISFVATKKSKNPCVEKSVILKDKSLVIEAGSNAGDAKQSGKKTKTQSDKGV